MHTEWYYKREKRKSLLKKHLICKENLYEKYYNSHKPKFLHISFV